MSAETEMDWALQGRACLSRDVPRLQALRLCISLADEFRDVGESGPPSVVRHLRKRARGPLLCIILLGLEVDGLVPLATTPLGSNEKTWPMAAG